MLARTIDEKSGNGWVDDKPARTSVTEAKRWAEGKEQIRRAVMGSYSNGRKDLGVVLVQSRGMRVRLRLRAVGAELVTTTTTATTNKEVRAVSDGAECLGPGEDYY